MFAALALPNADGYIAKYNVDRYVSGSLETVDVDHLSGLGSGAVPYLDRLACFTIGDPVLTCPLAVVYKKNGFLSPAARSFIDITRQFYSRFNHT